MSPLIQRVQKVLAAVIEIVLVGLCLSLVTVAQKPNTDTMRLYVLLYVIFSNSILVWAAFNVLGERQLSRLAVVCGKLTLGTVRELVPFRVSDTVVSISGSIFLLTAVVGAFSSGLLDRTVLLLLSKIATQVAIIVTYIYWLPIEFLWGAQPASLNQLYQFTSSNTVSLAAAGAITLSELIDSTTATNAPDERV